MLMLCDRLTLERFAMEIAAQHESAIILNLVPVEAEEGMLGLEVSDLQEAVDLGMKAGTATSECQFGLR